MLQVQESCLKTIAASGEGLRCTVEAEASSSQLGDPVGIVLTNFKVERERLEDLARVRP